jgi:hypothetical protein
MPSNVQNVYAGQPLASGVIFVAPLTTPAPTSAVSPLAPGFVDLGYVGADGFTERNERSVDQKRSFGGKTVKVLQTEFSSSVEVVLLESISANVLKAVFGEPNVTVTPATPQHGVQVKVNKNGRKLPYQSWVIDTWDDETGAKYRNYMPNAKITTVGDITVSHSDTIEYRITIEAFETTNGDDNIITFTDNGILGS